MTVIKAQTVAPSHEAKLIVVAPPSVVERNSLLVFIMWRPLMDKLKLVIFQDYEKINR